MVSAIALEGRHSSLYHIPEVVALDFDRTLADNGACMERLYKSVEGLPGINVAEIRGRKKEIEAAKKTFDPLHYVAQVLTLTDGNLDLARYAEFCVRFVGMREPKVLYDDAKHFLDMLQQADVPHIILTYGNNFEWQLLKLQAAGYPVSNKIMQDSNKGAQIKNYRCDDETFHSRVSSGGDAEYIADAMVLIDDKSSAFDEFPKEYPGFKIIREEVLPNQEGPIPDFRPAPQ